MRSYAAFTCLLIALVIPSMVAADPQDGVKLDIRAGRPVVDDVYVNGHGPYRFLVDTGSSLNQIDAALAQSIGLPVIFTTHLTSSIGIADASGGDTGEIRLGSAAADHQAFLFTSTDEFHVIARDVQGVLGQTFLSRFDYLLDVRGRRLTFGVPAEHIRGARLPFHNAEGRPVISTSLGSLVLDTGAATVIRFRVQGDGDARQMNTATGSAVVASVFSSLAIAGRTFWRGEAVALPQSPERDADGLMPISAFKSVYVSNSEGYVVLE